MAFIENLIVAILALTNLASAEELTGEITESVEAIALMVLFAVVLAICFCICARKCLC